MSKVVAGIAVSADGCAAGPNQSPDQPFGDGDVDQLHRWMFETPEENAAEMATLTVACRRATDGPGRGTSLP